MTRKADRAGSLRLVRAARLERAGAEVAGWVALAALLASAFAATVNAQDAAAPPSGNSAAVDSVNAQAPPAPVENAPVQPPATEPPAQAPVVETPKSGSVAPATAKPKRTVKRSALPAKSKTLAGSSTTAPLKTVVTRTQTQTVASKPAGSAAKGTAAAKAGTAASVASVRSNESVAVRRIRAATQAKAAAAAPAASIEERTTYQYNTLGRRDPFESMVESFVGDDVGGDNPPDVGGVTVVGIVWGADAFALVEDGRGSSLILRRGDKVMNGYVEELKRDAMIVKLTVDGQSQSVVVPLTRKGDQSNAKR